jgi:pyridoxine/pyridoxamine 5'-phosphate oxidase
MVTSALSGAQRSEHPLNRMMLLAALTETGMPFKSQAQRRKFAQLLVEGKISNETFEEWNRETGGKKLPERVRTKSKGSKKVGGRRQPRAARKR